MGHLRCGETLEKAFAADPRTAEVIHEDALKYTNKLFRDFSRRRTGSKQHPLHLPDAPRDRA